MNWPPYKLLKLKQLRPKLQTEAFFKKQLKSHEKNVQVDGNSDYFLSLKQQLNFSYSENWNLLAMIRASLKN